MMVVYRNKMMKCWCQVRPKSGDVDADMLPQLSVFVIPTPRSWTSACYPRASFLQITKCPSGPNIHMNHPRRVKVIYIYIYHISVSLESTPAIFMCLSNFPFVRQSTWLFCGWSPRMINLDVTEVP
jgi:hypothetical protein